MTFYELLKRVYWLLDEWIASSLGLGDYYGSDDADHDDHAAADDTSDKNEVDEVDDEDSEDPVDELEDEDDGYDDMYKYHDHQA
jgi:hypothetical protein